MPGAKTPVPLTGSNVSVSDLPGYVNRYFRTSCRRWRKHYGHNEKTVPFYEKCGFVRSHRIPGFFTDHYDHPIYEAGVQLVDMVYLR